MSWSLNAVGKASAVAKKLANDAASIQCSEPEETIKNGVAAIIATALAAYPETYAVSVSASGSQSSGYSADKPSVALGRVNTLTVSISPMYGFVE